MVPALLRRGRLLVALAVTACLTPTDPGAGEVGELRVRARYAAGAEPGTLGVQVDSALVVADPAAEPLAPAVDETVALAAPDASLAWLVDVQGDTQMYHVRLELRGDGRALYRGEADVAVPRGGIGQGAVHDVPVAYVGPGAIAEITVSPGAATLVAAGATQGFQAVARDADGEVVEATFTWTSDADGVATVDAGSGIATAVATGVATITASAKGANGAASLTVAEGGLFVEVTPSAVTLPALGATRQLTATARDGGGTVITDATFAWTAESPAIVTVDGAGLASAVAEGSGLVIAETGGVADTAEVGVAVVTTVEVSPGSATLAAFGATRQYSAVARRAGGEPVEGVEFSWASSNQAVATVDPGTGLATAVGDGEATITAAAGAVSDDATLTVAQAVATVTVTPEDATLTAAGATLAYAAAAFDANGNPVPDLTFTWTSSAPSAATVDPATGVATAVGTGRTTITATAAGVSGATTLTVAVGGLVVSVTPEAATLTAIGTAVQLDAAATDASGTPIADAEFVWTSRDPDVAGVDPSGRVSAAGEGVAWIVATTGDGADSAAITVAIATAVEVSPGTATLTALGGVQAFTAVARDAAGNVIPGATFTWASDAPTVAAVDPVSGVATAVGNGAASIAATTGGAAGSATLTVTQAVATVTLTPGIATLDALGATQAFAALARDENGNPVTRPVTFVWSGGPETVATVDPATGVATATGNGAAVIAAIAEGVSGTAALLVDQVVTAVEVTPGAATLAAFDATAAFTAVGRDASGNVVPDAAFAWTTSAPAVATVDGAGLVTAVSNGEASVTATADGATGGALVTVAQAVATIEVTPATTTLTALDETRQLAGVARDANGNAIARPVTFAWASDRPDVAGVDATAGLVTAVAEGAATITASAEGASGSAAITVDQLVSSVEVTPGSATLTALGATQQFTASGRDANGFPVPDAVFAWISRDGTVATVDTASGLAVAVGPGTAIVQAAVAGGATGTATLLVSPVVVGVEVTPAAATLVSLGETLQLAATARDANGNAIPGVTFEWAASDPAIVTVDPATGLVTAVANGDGSVTATADGVSGSAAVTVQQAVATVEVTPDSAMLTTLGATQAFAAVARDARGSVVAGVAFSWSSGDPAVATVDPASGLATAAGNGTVAISATASGASGAGTLVVRQVVASIEVTPAEATLTVVGATQPFAAVARDAGGSVVPDAVFAWETSDTAVATVDPLTGVATAVANGTATVTARADGAAGTATLVVCVHVEGAPPTCEASGGGHGR